MTTPLQLRAATEDDLSEVLRLYAQPDLDNGRVLFRALRPAGFTGAPHETLSAKSRNWTTARLRWANEQ
mgnify:CR=1 FL=1